MVRLSYQKDVIPLVKKLQPKYSKEGGGKLTLVNLGVNYSLSDNGVEICIGTLRECFYFLKGMERLLD